MSDIDELLSQIPVDDIAARLGVEPAEADAAVKQAIPALLHGLQTTAESGDQAGDLQAAVADDDGDHLVATLFGDKTDDVAGALSDQVPAAAVDQGLVKKLLPILAPIVIAFVMKKISGDAAPSGEQSHQGGGLGDILSGALGGGGGSSLGSILGGLLGGGSSGSGGSGGALGGILGDLLGGKK